MSESNSANLKNAGKCFIKSWTLIIGFFISDKIYEQSLYTFFLFYIVVVVCFLRQSFSVALGTILNLALVDQAGLELTEIHLLLPPKC